MVGMVEVPTVPEPLADAESVPPEKVRLEPIDTVWS